MSEQKYRDTDLITELSLTKALLGDNGVIEALQNARASAMDAPAVYVFLTVNTQLKITIEEIKKTNSRDDVRKVAIGFYGYFLNEIFQYSFSRIYKGLPVKVPQQIIYLHSRLIKTAKIEKPKNDIDRLISEHFKTLDEKIKIYKKTN